jgi:hypothetical protein
MPSKNRLLERRRNGNDYADQRYMTPGNGGFITPDRGTGGAKQSDLGTWNYGDDDTPWRIRKAKRSYPPCHRRH